MIKVFISWSGYKSQKIAEELRRWLPAVIQRSRPYFTPEDTEKGTRWSSEIQKELEDAQIGIFVLTNDNINNPWINFEAGAISKSIDKNAICTLLFGIEPSDVPFPLAQFQATMFKKEEARKLVFMLNDKTGDSKLQPDILSTVFEKWWPDLEEKIHAIMKDHPENEKKIREDRDILEEILSHVRNENRNQDSERISSHIISEILRIFNEFIFGKYKGEKFTESQIKAITLLEVAIQFDFQVDPDSERRLLKSISQEKEKLERHLLSMKKKLTDFDDDIPF